MLFPSLVDLILELGDGGRWCLQFAQATELVLECSSSFERRERSHGGLWCLLGLLVGLEALCLLDVCSDVGKDLVVDAQCHQLLQLMPQQGRSKSDC